MGSTPLLALPTYLPTYLSIMTSRKDTYTLITEAILAQLDAGVLPWRKTWEGGAELAPRSISSGKPYSGVNDWLLTLTGQSQGYSSAHWGTFNAIRKAGGMVRKGEKGSLVAVWKWLEVTDDKTGRKKEVPFLRHFSVFNAAQADWPDGMPEAFAPTAVERDLQPLEIAESIMDAYLSGVNPPRYTANGGDNAFYNVIEDAITVPRLGFFERAEEYYSAAFHELGHSTGHPSRLNRSGITGTISFGTEEYSMEELIAEFTSCFLCGDAGIVDTRENSAAYIASWAKVLRSPENRKMIVQAAGRAHKAATLIRKGGEAA